MALNRVLIKQLFVGVAILLLFPMRASAHVRWFVPDAQYSEAFFPSDLVAIAMVVGILSLGVFARWITTTDVLPAWIQRFCRQKVEVPHAFLWHILACIICVFLLVHLLEGGFVAPNLTLPTHLQKVGVIAQSLLLLMVPISISLFGLGLALLGLSLFVLFPSGLAIDYVFEFFGIGFTLFLIGPSLNGLDKKWADFLVLDAHELRLIAIKVLRVFLGVQLAVLALHNKLFNPGIALAFLDAYPVYNFFTLLPFDALTPIHFVLFVGCSELLLGVMLVFGAANRIVQLMLFGVFALTSYVAGIEELIGHLPILAILALLLSESTNPQSKEPLSANQAPSPVTGNLLSQQEAPPSLAAAMASQVLAFLPKILAKKTPEDTEHHDDLLLDDDLLDYQWDEDTPAEPSEVPVLTEALSVDIEDLQHNTEIKEDESDFLIVESWDESIFSAT